MEILGPPSSAERICAFLASTRIFGHLDPKMLSEIAGRLEWVRLAEGETLFTQGDRTTDLYIVVQGSLKATAERDGRLLTLAEIQPGEPTGEISALTGAKRSATVRAASSTTLLKLPPAGLKLVTSSGSPFRQYLAPHMLRRVRRDHLVGILPHLFGELDQDTLKIIEAEMEWVQLPSGSMLFRQGDPGDSLYLIVSGRLCASFTDERGGAHVVAQMGHGDSVGEMAILTEEGRSSSVYAIRDCELVRLSRASFFRVVQQRPRVVLGVTRAFVKRYRKSMLSSWGDTAPRTFAVLPLGAEVPVAELTRRLEARMAAFGSVFRLDEARVDDCLQTPGIALTAENDADSLRLATWLDVQEIRHRFVIYEAASSPSPWTRRCVHQADCVVLVGVAGSDPAPREVEQALSRAETDTPAARRILVLLHPDGRARPSGTHAWLERRALDAHYHVRLDREGDFDRLARLLTGRATGLVLGGGGARGFSHIGAIRALQEVGIPIDAVGGTSIGSVIGAQYAFGLNSDAMVHTTGRFFNRSTYDLTLPLTSLIAGRRIVHRLRECFGEVRIEDLWTPYFCVSSSLMRAEEMVHRSGPLWRAVRASGSLPGIVPPVPLDGDLLVDGALLNNLPVDVMRKLCGDGPVIAEDVSQQVDLGMHLQSADSLSGWRILRSSMNPLEKEFQAPHLVGIVMRATELASVRAEREMVSEAATDLYLRPPVDRYGLLEVEKIQEIVDIGYRYARERLAEWWKGAGVV